MRASATCSRARARAAVVCQSPISIAARGARCPPCGLALERRSFLADGRVGEFTRSWYRGDIHEFVAELQSE